MVERFRIIDDRARMVLPAGRFEDCVVVESRSWMPSREERIIRRVYAPGVGLVRLMTLIRSGARRPTPMVDMKLLSYEIPEKGS